MGQMWHIWFMWQTKQIRIVIQKCKMGYIWYDRCGTGIWNIWGLIGVLQVIGAMMSQLWQHFKKMWGAFPQKIFSFRAPTHSISERLQWLLFPGLQPGITGITRICLIFATLPIDLQPAPQEAGQAANWTTCKLANWEMTTFWNNAAGSYSRESVSNS